MFRLEELGWHAFFERQCTTEDRELLLPARVAGENRGIYRLFSERGEWRAELAGKLRFAAASRADLPAVGDWVLVRECVEASSATIQRILKRRSRFSRKVAGNKTEEQILAANVDIAFLVSSLNSEFSLRRIERYVSLAWESGAQPVVVMNKADLCEDAEAFRRDAESAGLGVRVILTSALRGDGVNALRGMLRSGITAALLGSSGVGKSTLINAILDEARQTTGAVRRDDKGRHTTSVRQLIVVPGGGVLLDTPGMRELQLWNASEGLEHAFADIQELALRCKFRDCRHEREPGCAVQAGLADGSLDAGRLASYHKLGREDRFLEAKQDAALRADRKKAVKRIMREAKRFCGELDR